MDDRHARHRRTTADRRRRPAGGYRASGADRFTRLTEQAIAALPAGLLSYLDGVHVTVEEVPPTTAGASQPGDGPPLGMYWTGTRSDAEPGPPLDRLTLFRRPLEARASDRHELAELVREAVVDEIARRFGIDDDELDRLGWT